MAAASQSTDETDRRVLLAALLGLGFVTGVAFGRAFAGAASPLALGLTGAVAVAMAAAMARRHLALSLLASAAVLFLLMTWIVVPRSTWFGIPTDETVRALMAALSRSTERVATEVAPAPALNALMAPAMLAVWAAATSAHALAVRSRSVVLPLLPCAALLAFAGVVAEDGSRPGYVAVFLAAALAVVYGSSLVRLRSWGPAVGGGRWGRAGGLGRWARRLGLAAVAVALILPWLLPGFESKPLLAVDRPGARVAVNPFVDIRPNLLQNPPARLFTVRANRDAYWRMLALDRFDGRVWTASDLVAQNGIPVTDGSLLGGPIDQPTARVDQEITIQELSVPWLPAAYRPVIARAGDAKWDGGAGTLALEEDTQEGYTYGVSSEAPIASPVELDQIDPALADVPEAYTALPAALPPRIHEIALALTADAPNPFRGLLAIQEFLRTFKYDERAPAGHGVDDILYFLEQSRRGYCEQFAGTMTVLARSLGWPARVAVGFLSGSRNRRDGSYQVTSDDVHAWTEVHFGKYGWLAFEPTPTRTNPGAGYLTPPPAGVRPDANLGGAAAGAAPGQESSRGAAQREAQDLGRGTGIRAPAVRPVPAEEPSVFRRLVPVALILVAAALVLIPPAKLVARRRALRRRRSPREGVLGAYGVVLWAAEDLGLGRHSGETPWEYRGRLRSEVAFSDGDLERLTDLAGRALYAKDGVRTPDADRAAEAARALLKDLRRHVGPGRALAGSVRPSRPS
jgi:transglutaminase-like putative cysteine protease